MLDLHDRDSSTRRRLVTLRGALALLVGAAFAIGLASRAADAAEGSPRGKYRDAKTTAKFTEPPLGERSRVRFRDGLVRVKRRHITEEFEDADVEVLIQMDLLARVEETDRQVVEVADGEFFLRDRQTGAIIAAGGDFNRATFKITRRAEDEWRIKHKKKLSITEIDGGAVWTVTKAKLSADKMD